jgi:hypothetical protein
MIVVAGAWMTCRYMPRDELDIIQGLQSNTLCTYDRRFCMRCAERGLVQDVSLSSNTTVKTYQYSPGRDDQ